MSISQDNTRVLPDFTRSDRHIAELLERAQRIADLSALGALADWDQNTALAAGGAEVRGAQLATLSGVLHELWTASRISSLLDELEKVVGQTSYTDADRALTRDVRRAYDHAIKLPRELVEEKARVSSASFEAWKQAKGQSDFSIFAPWLSQTIALDREIADRYGYAETRYDALLDLYEPGLTASKVDALFRPVREVSTTMLQRIVNSGNKVDASCLEGDFPIDEQVDLCERILRGMGYDFSRGGIAQSPHPFMTSFGSPFDVRLTIRPDRRYLQAALMAAIHEGGHAVYEQGSAPTLVRTLLAGGTSLGMHESQSRLWENYIGRSEPYWRGQFELIQDAFTIQYASTDAATFARALNKVQPSLIRVEADEVTYNLHIIVRFELEKAMVNGDVAVESLPRLWNEKYHEYLGIKPEKDAEGVLQDVHWTSGFGYFPTYTLGNLYGAQIYAAMRRAFPDFDDRLASGDTSFALGWLREHMYLYGSVYQPVELMKRITGEAPDPSYFARYLISKFETIYRLQGR